MITQLMLGKIVISIIIQIIVRNGENNDSNHLRLIKDVEEAKCCIRLIV